jgi:hypothetical protein
LDSLLARNCSRDPDRDFLACEISESASFVLDCAVWLAFLGGLRGAGLAADAARQCLLRTLDGEEALIEKYFPENIAC